MSAIKYRIFGGYRNVSLQDDVIGQRINPNDPFTADSINITADSVLRYADENHLK